MLFRKLDINTQPLRTAFFRNVLNRHHDCRTTSALFPLLSSPQKEHTLSPCLTCFFPNHIPRQYMAIVSHNSNDNQPKVVRIVFPSSKVTCVFPNHIPQQYMAIVSHNSNDNQPKLLRIVFPSSKVIRLRQI